MPCHLFKQYSTQIRWLFATVLFNRHLKNNTTQYWSSFQQQNQILPHSGMLLQPHLMQRLCGKNSHYSYTLFLISSLLSVWTLVSSSKHLDITAIQVSAPKGHYKWIRLFQTTRLAAVHTVHFN